LDSGIEDHSALTASIKEGITTGAARRYAPPRRWQCDGGMSFCRQSGHLRQSMDPKIAADLRPSADRSAVRTYLAAGGGYSLGQLRA